MHVVLKPAAVWLGLVVAWSCGMWHELHVVERPLYTPPWWHVEHCRPACPPVSGNVAVWMKFTPCHPTVLWHWLQVVLNPAEVWLGLVVAWYCGMWQELHVVESPVNTPPT